jgi:hypothetical protein
LQQNHTASDGSNNDVSMPVKRTVSVGAPLRGAVESLFSESITAKEDKDGFWSPTLE